MLQECSRSGYGVLTTGGPFQSHVEDDRNGKEGNILDGGRSACCTPRLCGSPRTRIIRASLSFIVLAPYIYTPLPVILCAAETPVGENVFASPWSRSRLLHAYRCQTLVLRVIETKGMNYWNQE